jgi:hypothetical protein
MFDGTIESFGSNFYTWWGHAPVGTPEVVTMPPNTRGDSVRIALLGPGRTGEQVLSLAEVEVVRYGLPPRYQSFGSGCRAHLEQPHGEFRGPRLPRAARHDVPPQAMVFDRPANALGASFSNGAQLIIGM